MFVVSFLGDLECLWHAYAYINCMLLFLNIQGIQLS